MPQIDPRYYQITLLSLLLSYGVIMLDFSIEWITAVVILITAQSTQWIATKSVGLARFDPRSALISSLSLCLLLRTDSLWLAALITVIAISSKFLIRLKNKHVFNPTNFALVVGICLFDQVWVSSGQWGREVWFLFLVAGLGILVVMRSRRTDITLAFLTFYSLMVFGRAWWLGDPLQIPLHQLQNGALLVFAFFMISDPITSPNSRPGRLVFALLVCLIAGTIQFILFRQNGVLFALVITCLFTPLLDRLFPAEKFTWAGTRSRFSLKGEKDVQTHISV